MKPLKKSFPVTFRIDGTLKVSTDAWNFFHTRDPDVLVFRDFDGLKVHGDGMIDGQGFQWWIREYMQTNPPDMKRPRLFNGYNLDNFEMHGIFAKNSPRFFFRFNDCDGVYIHDMEIYTDIWGQLMIDDLFNPAGW